MYHSIYISELDQHTHRFLWRDLNTERSPETYVMQVVSFGDRPAGAIAAIGVRKTALKHKDNCQKACNTLIRNIYVDDILDSVGTRKEAELLSKEVTQILASGGFEIKSWMYSGDGGEKNVKSLVLCSGNQITEEQRWIQKTTEEINEEMDDSIYMTSVLGMRWHTVGDYLFFKVRLNFSPKKRKRRTGPDLIESEIMGKFPEHLTRRDVVAQVNGFFDPLGLATPVTVAAKILVRRLWVGEMKEKGWDDDIPDNERREWMKFFVTLYDMQKVKFGRALQPVHIEGEDPVLVIFSDASENAYGSCCYARWKMSNGSYRSNLITSKSKIAPIKKLNIVRLELNAAVMATRLKAFIVKECRFKFSRVYFLVDSEIVLAMVQKDSYIFGTFVGSRVAEIQRSTDLTCWFWVEGALNVADWVTRPRLPEEIGHGSIWQDGPEFLCSPEEEWPIQRECKVLDIPEIIKTVMVTTGEGVESLIDLIDLKRFSSYRKLIKTTARILSVFKKDPKPSLKRIGKEPQAKDYEGAITFWMKECQKEYTMNQLEESLERLCPHLRPDGIWVVGARAQKWVAITEDHNEPILIPYNHRFTRIYAEFIHNISHSGVATTMTKIRLKYWIINLKQMVKSIVYRCITCRAYRKETMSQRMGVLPVNRCKPAPPWYSVSVDLFGPYEIRGSVNKRGRSKIYGVLFNCLVTRAVHTDVVTSYNTDAFLMALRRFVSIRRYPAYIYSDHGPQLKAASKELKGVIKELDRESLAIFGVEKGVEWRFSAPDSPWQNGCAEALIRSTKKALTRALGKNILTLDEIQTVFFESANLLNERPIGKHPTSPEEGAYLCPNDLLLGRATARVPGGAFKEYTSNKRRFLIVQEITNTFWRKMIRSYFPSLLIRPKWHTLRRNVKIGDIVLVQDRNVVRGEWRIGMVCKADASSSDGVVRTCWIKYKERLAGLEFPKRFKTFEQAVQRLVILVPVDEKNEEEDS